MPASSATSSRRRPAVRRRGPSAMPTSAGRIASRRRRRKSASWSRCMTPMVPRGGRVDPGSDSPTMNAPLPPVTAWPQGGGRSTTKENTMQVRTLGHTGPAVSALGLGAMGMSGAYGAADRTESIATVHTALEAGVTLIDTGDFYGMGHNELLLAEALRGRDRDSYQLSVKFGAMRGPGAGFGGQDCRPQAVRNFLA